MIYLRIQFPTGRFHATPWGSHVNEGIPEWPPSPWRILRGLISVGFTHWHWHPGVPDDAAALITELAECVPAFSLPPAIETHTRHYMPVQEGSKVNSAKVFDTCVRLKQSDAVWVKYDVDLSPQETCWLERLASHLAYLGRAESWVDISMHQSCNADLAWTVPAQESTASRGVKLVRVLSTTPPSQYAIWRSRELDGCIAQFTESKGKKPTPKQREKLESPYPIDLIGCLLTDTASLQKAGWSQPPGSKWVDYSIPQSPPVSVGTRRKRQRSAARPEAALLSLTSDSIRGRTLPRESLGVFVGENLHKACVAKVATLTSDDRELATFTGRDRHGELIHGHRHAHFIPLCLQGNQKHIDHILVFARDGFGPSAQRALAGVEAIYSAGLPKTYVTLSGFGDLQQVRTEIDAIARSEVNLIGVGRKFESVTPYVASRHLKLKNDKYRLEDNVADECQFRGLPVPFFTRVIERNRGKFRIARIGAGRQPPQAEGWRLELRFDEPVSMSQLPLALGYGSHFGLGVFQLSKRPVPECNYS